MIDLFIEGYRADVREDLSALITFAIDDIKDFSSRNTSFSKTIIMPGSTRNNALFGNIFDLANGNFYTPLLPNVNYNFNAAKSASAIIFQDNIQVFKGVLRLLQIVVDKGSVEYEVAVFGELGGLMFSMGNSKLEDLDFSAHDIVYSNANIVASWDNTPGSGVYFPLMDYGNYSTTKHSWQYQTFRPSLYVKEYLDKIFAAVGYTFSSNLFNSARFKSLVIPNNTKILTTQVSNLLGISLAGSRTLLNSGTSNNVVVPYDTKVGSLFTANSTKDKFTYNGTPTVTLTVNWNMYGTDFSTVEEFTMQLKKNGTVIASKYFGHAAGTVQYWTWASSVSVTLATGDYLEFWIHSTATLPSGQYFNIVGSTASAISATPATAPVVLGDTIKINDVIPKNILQIDFFASLIKLFNLYVYEDKYTSNLLYIEPYIDYYDGNPLSGQDWTQKIDRSQPMKIKPMSELNSRIYKFVFKDDSDYYNDLYEKRYNLSYGSYLYDSEFQFSNAENVADVIFSGTPLVGYAGEDKVYSTIFKRTGTSTLVEENVDSNIRILQTKKITGVSSWNILDGATVLSSNTAYGYAGHLDSPDAPANDIQFGVPSELFFTLASGALNVNQFNVYWSPYMAEITDKDSRLLTAYARLNTKDIQNIDFSKLIYIDGVCFRINKIIDYNASNEDLCQVELLKVTNTSLTTIIPIAASSDFVFTYTGDGTEGSSISIPSLVGKNIILVIQGTAVCKSASSPVPNEYNFSGSTMTFGTPIMSGQFIQILYN